ncbi:MAG: hypothetical protein NC816_00090 [Candidatus Omnitrophica bacterium]|nr:hypothetical protein [Candidatus Omnitrophota bacterium]
MRKIKVIIILSLIVFSILFSQEGQKETRFHQYSKKAKGMDGKLEVVSASWYGKEDVDKFFTGEILNDGKILLAGISGNKGLIIFLNKDGNKIEEEKKLDGANIYFLKQAKNETIYFSGKSDSSFIDYLNSNEIEIIKIPPPSDTTLKGNDMFLSKMSKDGKIEKVYIFEKAEGLMPDIGRVGLRERLGIPFFVLSNGELLLQVYKKIYKIDTKGEIKEIGKSNYTLLGVDEKRGYYIVGGDTNTSTGREPWRCPRFFINKIENGETVDSLWNWNPKVVGDDKYRLVSDSGFMFPVLVTTEGEYVVIGWSDGGNTVFLREPKNLDVGVKYGFIDSLWGAKVGKFSRIMKVKPEGEFIGGSIWCAFLTSKNQPNSSFVTDITITENGNIAFISSNTHNIVESPDSWSGNYLKGGSGYAFSIFSSDFKDLLFSSAIPDAILYGLTYKNKKFLIFGSTKGIGSGCQCEVCKSRKLILKNQLQAEFGGNEDAYFLIAQIKEK